MEVYCKKSKSKKRKTFKLTKWKVSWVLHLRKIFNLLKMQKKVKWMKKKVLASTMWVVSIIFLRILTLKTNITLKLDFRLKRWNKLKKGIQIIHHCPFRNNKISNLFKLMFLKTISTKMIMLKHNKIYKS